MFLFYCPIQLHYQVPWSIAVGITYIQLKLLLLSDERETPGAHNLVFQIMFFPLFFLFVHNFQVHLCDADIILSHVPGCVP